MGDPPICNKAEKMKLNKEAASWSGLLESVNICKLCSNDCKEDDTEDTSECLKFIPE